MHSTRSFVALATLFTIGAGASAAGAATHQVQPGDTLGSIASRYGTTVANLVKANSLIDPNLIFVGQRLTIPDTATAPPAPAQKAPSSYTVKAGDTLAGIAISLGVSLTELVRVNGVTNPDLIYVGTTLTVPGGSSGGTASDAGSPTTPSPAVGASAEHIVASGETLGAIATQYGLTVTALAGANGITNPDLIFIGQRLAVPTSLPVALFGRSATSPSKVALVPIFNRWADANGIPRDLVKAVAYHESGWNNDAVSSVGALGIGQIMPDTATYISTVLIGVRLDPRVPEDNIRMSARYLRYLLEETGGDANQALASYYQGLGSVRSRGWYDDTKQYVANVNALRGWFV